MRDRGEAAALCGTRIKTAKTNSEAMTTLPQHNRSRLIVKQSDMLLGAEGTM